jgi:hypothetical protein
MKEDLIMVTVNKKNQQRKINPSPYVLIFKHFPFKMDFT